MSLTKLILIFCTILAIFSGIIFFKFSPKFQPKAGLPLDEKTLTSTATINKHTFNIELAKTSKEQVLGLSGRTSMPRNQGMLFVFDNLDYHSFWMKKMKFPIDIIFIKDDLIISIEENAKPPTTNINPPIIKPITPVNKVLEINAGLSKKYNIKKGDDVELKLK